MDYYNYVNGNANWNKDSLETWQDQFDSGNNYFTIQAYCVDIYDPIKNTINYDYKYLSQNDRKFKDKVKDSVQ